MEIKLSVMSVSSFMTSPEEWRDKRDEMRDRRGDYFLIIDIRVDISPLSSS